MSKAFIRSLSGAIKKATHVQSLLLKQKKPTEDIAECIEEIDSIVNILHGLREEEIEIAKFDCGFLDNYHEALDELEAEESDED